MNQAKLWMRPSQVFGSFQSSLEELGCLFFHIHQLHSMSPPSTNGTHQLRPPSNNDESYAKEPSTNPFYRPNNEVTLAMTTYNNPPTQTLEQRLEIPSTHATTSFDAHQGGIGIEDEPEIYVPGRY